MNEATYTCTCTCIFHNSLSVYVHVHVGERDVFDKLFEQAPGKLETVKKVRVKRLPFCIIFSPFCLCVLKNGTCRPHTGFLQS